MKKILLLLFIIILASLTVSGIAYADDLVFSNITFVKENDTFVQSYPALGEEVYANVDVKNTSDEEKFVFLVAGCYKDGVMTDIFISSALVNAGESKTVTTKIDINSTDLNVVANCILNSDLTRACIRPANMLVDTTDIEYITINGNKLEGYSNSVNSYSATVSTPMADVKAVAGDSTTAVKIKKIYIPGFVKINITSQFGSDRTIVIDCKTTNPQPRPITNTNVILRTDYNDNTGLNIYDKNAKKWTDLSGYKNDISLVINSNNLWTNDGFLVTGGSLKEETSTHLSQNVTNAINTFNCSIQFEILNINAVESKHCGIMSSPNQNFIIYKEKDKNTLLLNWGGAVVSLWRPSITTVQALSGINTIVINNVTSLMSWYVNGELLSEKPLRNTTELVDGLTLSNFVNGYGGSVTFKSITIYDRALSQDEIEVSE